MGFKDDYSAENFLLNSFLDTIRNFPQPELQEEFFIETMKSVLSQ